MNNNVFYVSFTLETNGCDKFKNVMQTLEKMHRSFSMSIFVKGTT
jgi:hypothetical protein